ncbi:MAG: hypothetical protein ABIF92_01345, partial [archaeon]
MFKQEYHSNFPVRIEINGKESSKFPLSQEDFTRAMEKGGDYFKEFTKHYYALLAKELMGRVVRLAPNAKNIIMSGGFIQNYGCTPLYIQALHKLGKTVYVPCDKNWGEEGLERWARFYKTSEKLSKKEYRKRELEKLIAKLEPDLAKELGKTIFIVKSHDIKFKRKD